MAVIEVNNPIIGVGGGRKAERRTLINHTQALALRATPVTLVPAPGAGKAIVIDRVTLVFDVTTTGYTESAANIAIEYSGGSDILTIETTGFIDQATDQVRVASPAEALATPVANEAVQALNNGAGEWTGGNAANTLSINVEYHIVATTAAAG